MSLCYSVLYGHYKQKRKRGARLTWRPPLREHVWKAQDALSFEDDCNPVAKRILTDGKSEVEEPWSEHKIKDESGLEGNSAQATKSVFTDKTFGMPGIEATDQQKRKSYLIMTTEDRKYKSVYSPEVPPRYKERSIAALLDAINFLNDALGTTSCSEDEPYKVCLESYAMFECELTDAEYKLLKGHKDVEEISELMCTAPGLIY